MQDTIFAVSKVYEETESELLFANLDAAQKEYDTEVQKNICVAVVLCPYRLHESGQYVRDRPIAQHRAKARSCGW